MSSHPRQGGFTLVEVLVALFLVGLGLLAVAPLFVYASRTTASAADMGDVGAAGVERMEILRARSFSSLSAGGSLSANVVSFFDASDPRVLVRWTISDNATPPYRKTITVRSQAVRTSVGLRKEVTLTTVRSR